MSRLAVEFNYLRTHFPQLFYAAIPKAAVAIAIILVILFFLVTGLPEESVKPKKIMIAVMIILGVILIFIVGWRIYYYFTKIGVQ